MYDKIHYNIQNKKLIKKKNLKQKEMFEAVFSSVEETRLSFVCLFEEYLEGAFGYKRWALKGVIWKEVF